MPERCVAARCSNVKDPDRNISMHKMPFFGDVCPIKRKRRKKWVDFVLERRKPVDLFIERKLICQVITVFSLQTVINL